MDSEVLERSYSSKNLSPINLIDYNNKFIKYY